ncbi:unnamed protein product [Chrysodeixis includens]|uniref:Uncharacterized protein n=1 Tax=Chrysodeixis includens TaxID=689277 RepID=A0A9P0BUK3_CHRIL|nr:unnamed protein product [Chrysodeixis includens]
MTAAKQRPCKTLRINTVYLHTVHDLSHAIPVLCPLYSTVNVNPFALIFLHQTLNFSFKICFHVIVEILIKIKIIVLVVFQTVYNLEHLVYFCLLSFAPNQ